MRERVLHQCAVLSTMLCLSFIGIFVKLINGGVPGMTVGFLRTAIGFVFLLSFVPWIDASCFHNFKKEMKHYACIGLLMAIGFTLTIFALNYAPVSNVVLIMTTNVIFVSLLASHFLHEKLSGREKGALALGLVGVVVMNPFQGGYIVGNVLALLVAITGALLVVFMRAEEKNHTAGASMWFLFFAMLFLSPAPFIWGWGNLPQNWFWLLMLGILCTGLAYLLLSYGIQKVKADDVSIISMLTQPVFSITLAYFLLGEVPTGRMLLGGGVLVIAGIILEMKKMPPPNIMVHSD